MNNKGFTDKEFIQACFLQYDAYIKSKRGVNKMNVVEKSLNGEGSNHKNEDYHNLDEIAKKIILIYTRWGNVTDFTGVVEKFKKQYINGESKIENNETKEEKRGIGVIYDYICNYNFDQNGFNIFVNSIDIHTKLFSKCIGKEFGGSLRTEQAVLFDTNIEVASPAEAMKRYNEYIMKSDSIMEQLDKMDIFEYINGCLKIMVDLIKIQPFADGNKRTFRSLFNLMIKRKNLPPVYIGNEESGDFKKALLSAMVDDNYEQLNRLYIRLICDSIVLLGLKEAQVEQKSEKIKKSK